MIGGQGQKRLKDKNGVPNWLGPRRRPKSLFSLGPAPNLSTLSPWLLLEMIYLPFHPLLAFFTIHSPLP